MEKRLLTLIDNTSHDDPERLESLQYSLANIRHQKATLELRLSPNQPGAEITINPSTHSSPPSFNPQPQAQAPAQLETGAPT